MASKKINTILSLKDEMSKPLVSVNKNVSNVTREMKKSANEINRWQKNAVKSIDKVVGRTAKIAGAAAGAFAGVAIGTGFKGMLELEDSSAKVKSIAGEALDLKNIQEELLKNSTKSKIAFDELADAQYAAISSGVNANDSMNAAVQASKLAVAGFTDTESALKLMTSTMNVFGMEGTDAMVSISDKMLTTQNLGVTSVGELANSLGSVTPLAKAAGVSLDDVLGATGALTKGGQATSEAMTGLKGMMTNIIKPTKQASDMAKQLGIDFSVAALKNKGFPAFLEEIKDKTGGNTDQMAKLFGSVQGLNAVLSLTSEEGFKDFNNILGEVQNSAGMTENAYETMTDTIGFKLKGLKNTAKNTFTEMMNSQSDVIGDFVEKIETWIEDNQKNIEGWIQAFGEGVKSIKDSIKGIFEFIKEHEKAITTVLVFVGTLYAMTKAVGTVSKTMDKWKKVGKNVGNIFHGVLKMNTISLIIVAIGLVVAAGYALYRNWDTIKEKASELGGMFAKFGEFMDPIIDFFKGIGESVWEVILEMVEALKPLWEAFRDTFDKIKEVVGLLMPILMPILGFIGGVLVVGVVHAFMTMLHTIKGVISAIAGILEGWLEMLSGVIDFIVGVFTGDWSRAWEGVKGIFDGIVSIIKGIWQGAIDLLTAPVNAMVDILDRAFKNKVEGIKKLWQGLKDFMRNPIKGTVEAAKKGTGWVRDKVTGGKGKAYAKGTSYSSAGYARIHEEGGEIRKLSSGETIIPADKSERLLRGQSTSQNVAVNVKVQGNVIGNKQFINELGEEVYARVNLALANM